ncbi:Phospholipase/carboxylesterase/thioesterase [Globomyces pollinis-pini]|nr:Phospholipase/carboxylesterase/thioesterase [Globomyces pollinis-pini]
MFNFPELEPHFKASKEGVNSNLLILLHGLGDTPVNFLKFGTGMQLPQTAIVSLKGPHPIPFFDEGSGWFPVVKMSLILEMEHDHPVVKAGIKKSRDLLSKFLKTCVFLSESNLGGWPPERVFLLGFSNGGTISLDLLLSGQIDNKSINLGGVISISGWLFNNYLQESQPCKVPICITQGKNDQTLSQQLIAKKKSQVVKAFTKSDCIEISGKGHTMPNTHVMNTSKYSC